MVGWGWSTLIKRFYLIFGHVMQASTDSYPAPKPLVYSGGVSEAHIVSICAHPSRDLLGVGDIVGKITL